MKSQSRRLDFIVTQDFNPATNESQKQKRAEGSAL